MQNKGIAFLIAVIVSSIALSLGLGIALVFLEELKISNINKDSFAAFFAADSGIDCALYWDIKQNAFPTSTPPVPVTRICNGQSVGVGSGSFKTSFLLGLGGHCAKVTVDKTAPLVVVITSLGQNIPCGAPATPRTVQRGIEVRY